MITVFLTLSCSSAFAAPNFHGLDAKDDCYESVVALAQGIAQSYRTYNTKPAHILNVELNSATEKRQYSVDVEHQNNIDSYSIVLSNDSAFKCLMIQITPTEIGG